MVDFPASEGMVCIGAVVVWVVMTVVMGGNLEVAMLLLGLEWVGICSANFPSRFSLLSSWVGILISILSG